MLNILQSEAIVLTTGEVSPHQKCEEGRMSLICQDCSMVFSSDSLLQRHKAQFCVGNAAGDPIATPKEPLVSDTGKGVEPKRTLTPELIKVSYLQQLNILYVIFIDVA